MSSLPSNSNATSAPSSAAIQTRCRLADDLLFRAGERRGRRRSLPAIGRSASCCRTALYVHRTALEALDPLLRVYEGCARAYLGTLDGANLIKLHRQSGKVSYLSYPDFETDPHPALRRSVKLSLRTREIDCFDYTASNNPPVLHRKETFSDERSSAARQVRPVNPTRGKARPARRHGDDRDEGGLAGQVERERHSSFGVIGSCDDNRPR